MSSFFTGEGASNTPYNKTQSPQRQPYIDVPSERIIDPPEPWQQKYKDRWQQYQDPAPKNAPKLPPGTQSPFLNNAPKPFDGWNPYQKPDKFLDSSKQAPFDPPKWENGPGPGGGGTGRGNATNSGGGAGGGAAGGVAGASGAANSGRFGAAASSLAGRLALGGAVAWSVLSWGDLTKEEQEQDALKRERQRQDNKNQSLHSLNSPQTYTVEAPPDGPGQYSVMYRFKVRRNQPVFGTSTYAQYQLQGPIKGLGSLSPGRNGDYGIFHGNNQFEKLTLNYYVIGAGSATDTAWDASVYTIMDLERIDGIPDTGPNAPPLPQNYTTNNYSNNNNTTNINNFSDAPLTPAQNNAQNGLGGFGPRPGSQANNSASLGGSFRPGARMPGLQSPNLSEPDPTNLTNDDPYRLPSPQYTGFPQSGLGVPGNAPVTTDSPKPFTGLPNGLMPPVVTPSGQTGLKASPDGSLTQIPTEDEKEKRENPSFYDLPQQMGMCCTNLGAQNQSNSQKIDQTNDKLDKLNTTLNVGSTGGIAAILTKLDVMQAFQVGKWAALWQHRLVDRALLALNIALAMHNAVMLSSNIAQTLGAAIDNIGALIGITPPEGTGTTITGAIGHGFEAMAKAVIGDENYTTLSTEFKKANRIYQAVTNSLSLIYDAMSGIAEGLEIIGKYNAKVGNALLRSGEILENSFGWMNETLHFKTGRLGFVDRVMRGLQNANEMTSDLEQVTGNLRNADENIDSIKEEWEQVREENEALETQKKEKEETAKTNSQSPAINPTDLIKPLPNN